MGYPSQADSADRSPSLCCRHDESRSAEAPQGDQRSGTVVSVESPNDRTPSAAQDFYFGIRNAVAAASQETIL
jgi:hypothetical protein